MPVFSKLPVVGLPDIPVVSGLKCTHTNCFALFSTLEDSKAHADAAHAGEVAATTCGIYERRLRSGTIKLYPVLDESGERHESFNVIEHLQWL
jgi:hypothetical protein